MSDRRMFSKRIVESSRFLKLPDAVQNLYFHLMMNTDDDGIVEAFTVLRICGATKASLNQLETAGLVSILNDDLVTYIEDWREQNTLSADRKKDSLYLGLLRRKRPDIEVLEKKARSDSKGKKQEKKQLPSMDSPRIAQDKKSQFNIRESNGIEDQSIYLSSDDGERDGTDKQTQQYRRLIADNISLELLLDTSRRHSPSEADMVEEIYDTICDVVCFPRETVLIRKVPRPWKVVKSQFLKLKYDHIAGILNRLIDHDLHIRNMKSYLVTALYEESMSGILNLEASLHDDELKMMRGQPY
ncbi:MAG: hypothetical protein IJH71_00715 [Eubacterium sp.]|nr:hypothetical protein [Eubacterium sp.]